MHFFYEIVNNTLKIQKNLKEYVPLKSEQEINRIETQKQTKNEKINSIVHNSK